MIGNYVDTRLLEVRSGIFFEYPKLKNTEKNLIFFLPFWENPTISESKEARLVEYNPINRGSALFAHTGANARNISISFYLTVPHIMRSINSVANSQALLNSLNTEKEKDRFTNKNPFEGNLKTTRAEDNLKKWKDKFNEFAGEEEGSIPYLGYGRNIRKRNINRAFRAAVSNPAPEASRSTIGEDGILRYTEDNALIGDGWKFDYSTKSLFYTSDTTATRAITESKQSLRTINTAVYIMETIRSCVAGHATTSILGPPVLRLRHGAGYNDVPLICKDYDISVEEDAGYDLKTLLPNRIKIKLRTSELRTGDFGKFSPGTYIKRDNLAGWEAVIEHGSADPGFLK